MVEKVIPKEEYYKALSNIHMNNKELKGCLFVYDEIFEKQMESSISMNIDFWLRAD